MKLNFLFGCRQRSFTEQFYYLKAVVERVNVYLTVNSSVFLFSISILLKMENFPQILKALHNKYLNEPENIERSKEKEKKTKQNPITPSPRGNHYAFLMYLRLHIYILEYIDI